MKQKTKKNIIKMLEVGYKILTVTAIISVIVASILLSGKSGSKGHSTKSTRTKFGGHPYKYQSHP